MIDESIADPDPRTRRALLDALALSFRDNPMNLALHGPRPKRRVRANRAGLRALVLDSAAHAKTRVIRHEGIVAGGFVVVPPGRYPIPGPGLERQLGCVIAQGVRSMDQWAKVAASLSCYHPKEPHWYLAVLGIVPGLQGHGLGTRLMNQLTQMMQSDPHPIYLESDRAHSVRFYESKGFVVRAETAVHGVRCWCLGRGFAGATEDLCDSVREC
jgi:ribosomal protein S18 acetylase RimI-like enzyme